MRNYTRIAEHKIHHGFPLFNYNFFLDFKGLSINQYQVTKVVLMSSIVRNLSGAAHYKQ